MNRKSTPPAGDMDEAIARALDAATAATEAAHEAEAVLAARSEAAVAMNRIARRSGLMAMAAGGAAILGLGLGALLWLRASADLREAAELQAAASAVFVERLAEMNGALDRLDQGTMGLDAGTVAMESRLSALVEQIDTGLAEMQGAPAPAADPALIERIDQLRADMIEAIAETQISIAQHLQAAPVAGPALIAAPAATQTAAPQAQKSTTRPAPNPAKPRPQKPRQDTNPFRYP